MARTGAGLQDWTDEDHGNARARSPAAGSGFRHPRIPRSGAAQRRDSARRPGAERGRVAGGESETERALRMRVVLLLLRLTGSLRCDLTRTYALARHETWLESGRTIFRSPARECWESGENEIESRRDDTRAVVCAG